jgi:hypothetical protein
MEQEEAKQMMRRTSNDENRWFMKVNPNPTMEWNQINTSREELKLLELIGLLEYKFQTAFHYKEVIDQTLRRYNVDTGKIEVIMLPPKVQDNHAKLKKIEYIRSGWYKYLAAQNISKDFQDKLPTIYSVWRNIWETNMANIYFTRKMKKYILRAKEKINLLYGGFKAFYDMLFEIPGAVDFFAQDPDKLAIVKACEEILTKHLRAKCTLPKRYKKQLEQEAKDAQKQK